MRNKFFAALLGCCTLTVAFASDPQVLTVGFQDFRGQYDLADGRVLTITQRGQRYFMQLDNQPETEIMAVGSAAFEAKVGALRLEFTQYANGNVPAVRVIDNSASSQVGSHPAPDMNHRSAR